MLVGRTGLSPVMVGRAADLDRLAGLVGARSVPSVALVAGEAGIGKTRLVQELVGAVPAGTLVLAGQADPGTVGRPMELFLDALDGAERREGPAVEPDGDLLAAVRDGDRPADERVHAAVDLVRNLTAGLTGLVVFEDLHWADSESLALFERLAEPDGGRLVVVGTYRPDGLSRRHPASDLLPRLDRRHSVTHVHLGRLTPAEVSAFLTAVYSAEPSFRIVDSLHDRTGGHPFFLEELVASSGETSCYDLETLPLPWTMAELVRSQFDDLAPEVRRMVSSAAVLGRRVSFDVLAAVTRSTEDELIELLRAAVDSGLLVETEPDVFGFHHEIAREAIEGGLLGRERRRLHEAALAALREIESRDHVALAHHARGAGRYDDMVEEARLGAHESLALGSSYQALQLAETGLTEAEDDLDLLAAAARAAWLADLLDAAVTHSDRWLRLAREQGSVSEEAAALSTRIRVAFELGEMESMGAFTDELIEIVDRLPADDERARAMAVLAQSHMLRERVDETCLWADRARELAEANDLTDVRIAAMVEKGSALIYSYRNTAEARDLLRGAAEEAERVGEHLLAARAFSNLLWHARRWDDMDEARALVERMRVQAEAAGFGALAGGDRAAALAQLAAVEGDLDAAIGHLDELDVRAGQHVWSKNRWTSILRAGLALEAGEVDVAARHTEDAKPLTDRTAAGIIGLDVHIACRRGEVDRARELLPALYKAMADEDVASPAQVHDLLAVALPAGLTVAELQPMIDLAGHYMGGRLAPDDAWRHLLDAQVAEATGDTETAARLYAAAADGFLPSLDVLAGVRGSTHVGAARNLVAGGDLDGARVHARAARGDLARWRGWRVTELEAVERRLGLGDVPSGPEALTPREREVAALIAEGLTNSQLADRLFISPRTAAVHVSNILAKLGMASRTEVAAWAASGGLEPDGPELRS
jgi:DNA-binding NarL/FixJ family response regulator